MKNKETTINEEIETLNKILEAAVEHGGDSGGPYFCNEEDLEKSIMRYLIARRLDDEYIITDSSHYPKIVKKED